MRCHCVDFAAPNGIAADLQAEDLLIHRAGWRFGLEMFVAGELSGDLCELLSLLVNVGSWAQLQALVLNYRSDFRGWRSPGCLV